MDNILIQLVGLGAIFFWVISIQKKEQHDILFLQAISNLFYVIQYFLLGVIVAGLMNLVSGFRCFMFYLFLKNKKDISKLWLIVFLVLLVLFGFLSYDGYLSLIPLIITIGYTITSNLKNSKWLRIFFLISAFVWIYYNFTVGAYVFIIGNILEIISGVVALVRFDRKKNV